MASSPWLLLCSWLVAGNAGAQPAQFRLELAAGAELGCIPAAELEAAVEQRLNALIFEQGEATHVIAIELARAPAPDLWNATLAMRERDGTLLGERQLSASGPHCRVLDEPLVLVVSTLVGLAQTAPEPTAAEEPRPAAPAEPPQQDQPAQEVPEAPAPAPPRPERPSSPRTPFRLKAAASGLLTTGSLPDLSLGAALGLHAQRHAFVVLASGLVLPHAREELGGGAYGRFSALLARLSLCGVAARFGRSQLAACPAVRGGALLAQTDGLAQEARRAAALVELELGVRLESLLTAPLGLFAAAGVTLPLTTPSFVITERGEVTQVYHQVGPGVLVELGIMLGRGS